VAQYLDFQGEEFESRRALGGLEDVPKWAFCSHLIEADPSAKLKALPPEHNHVQPLTQGEMQRLLAATDDCGFSTEVAYRVKTVILLMRWSGLACMDATTLSRDALGDDNN